MTATGTEARVCQDIADRQQVGLSKYGTSVEANPLGLLKWYKHHYTELLDAAVYVKRIIELMEGVQAPLTPEQRMAMEDPVAYLAEKNRQAVALRAIVDKYEQAERSTTLEDGSTLAASLGNPQPLDLTGVKELKGSGFSDLKDQVLTGFTESGAKVSIALGHWNPAHPHHDLRKTWKPGQRWQYRNANTSEEWTDRSGEPLWSPGTEYRRRPDDPVWTGQSWMSAEDVSKPVEKPWLPDDSGEWVEVTPSDFVPKPLSDDQKVYVLLKHDRDYKKWLWEGQPREAWVWSWRGIVAYKVVK